MNDLIIFDMDGTVLDTLLYTIDIMNASLSDMGYPVLEDEEYEPLLGASLYVMSKRLLEISNAKSEEKCIRDMMDCIRRNVLNGSGYRPIRRVEGIGALLTYLKQQGFIIAVLSNTPQDMVDNIIGQYLDGVFDGLYGESQRIERKPSPKGIEVIMSDFHTNREHTILIGDTFVDVETAKKAGIDFIGVTWGVLREEELAQSGIYAVAASNKVLAGHIQTRFKKKLTTQF